MQTPPKVAAFVAVFLILGGVGGRAGEPVTPGGMALLPGYKHEKMKGIDTRIGKIWKEGGLIIRYDIGRGAGNAAKAQPKDSVLWYKEQRLDGHTVQLAFTRDRTLFVTFPETSANFIGNAKGDEEIADMLLMVLTYVPPGKTK